MVRVVGPEKQRAVSVSLGLEHERALPHILFNNLCKIIFIKTLLIFLLVNYLQHEQRAFRLMDLLLSYLCITREEQQVLKILLRLGESLRFLMVSSQPCPQAKAGLIPPHKVLTLASGQAALHRVVPVPGSSVRAEGEAEAGRAVAYLKRAVGTKEGISFASSEVIDCLQVVVDCNIT